MGREGRQAGAHRDTARLINKGRGRKAPCPFREVQVHEDKCETVEIVSPESPDGFIVINKSDFDSSRHKVFGDETDAKPRKGKKG